MEIEITRIVQPMRFEKATKNTYRYTNEESIGEPPVLTSLYVPKWAVGSPPPGQITVTVEWEDG